MSIKQDTQIAKAYINKANKCTETNTNFELTLSQFRKLKLTKRCYYTGVSITLETNKLNTLTLDRIDNSLGYTLTNTVACSYAFNQLKSIWENPDSLLTQTNVTKALFILNEKLKR